MTETKPGGLRIWHAFALIAFLAAMTIFYGMIALLVSKWFHYPLEKDLALASLINILCFALIIFAGVNLFGISPRTVFPLKSIKFWLYPVLIILFTGVVILCSELDNLCRFLFRYQATPMFADAIAFNYWSALTAIVLIAPLTEETLFRGFLLQNLLKRYPAFIGILVSAALFSLMHMNLQQMPTAFAAGILLGWCFHRTRSLIPCILGHAINNAISVLITPLNFNIPGFSGGVDVPSKIQFQPLWFDGLGLLLLLIGIGCFALWTRKKRIDPLPEDPTGIPV